MAESRAAVKGAILVLGVAVLAIAVLFTARQALFPSVPPVAVFCLETPKRATSNPTTFFITNGHMRQIVLTDLIIETRYTNDWVTFSHSVPSQPQFLDASETKVFALLPPFPKENWRLRVIYWTNPKGPRFWWGKLHLLVKHSKWPGSDFKIMTVSNSCVSQEIEPIKSR